MQEHYSIRITENATCFAEKKWVTDSPKLSPETQNWCLESYGYVPRLLNYRDRKPGNRLWLRFENKVDATLFTMQFGY